MDDVSLGAADSDDFAALLQQLTISRRDPRSIRLAAVTSALLDVSATTDEQAQVSPNQIFAKTIAALEGTLSQDASQKAIADTIATQVALLELLTVTLPHITSKAFITSTLPLTARVLRALVDLASQAAATVAAMETKDELGGVNALLRWTCRAVSSVLPKIQTTADSALVKKLTQDTLLTLMSDKRPKVRKEAATGLAEVLTASEGCHDAIRKATIHFAHVIATNARKAPQDHDRLVDVVHLLGFLETSVFSLNFNKVVQDVMESFAVLVQDDNSQTMAMDFAAVSKVKESTPKILALNAVLSFAVCVLIDADEARTTVLDEMAPRILASLLQAKPSLVFRAGAADHDLLERGRTLWGQCILSSCGRAAGTKPEIALKLLPLSIQVITSLSKPSELDHGDASVADELMTGLTQLLRQSMSFLNEQSPSDREKCLHDSLNHLAHVMDPMYRSTWPVSLRSLALFIQLSHEHIQVRQHVQKLLALRNQAPAGSPSQHAVEDAFASLVQGVGIEVCWSWIEWLPPSSDGTIHLEQSWILAKLKSAMTSAQPVPPRIAFFQSNVLVAARSFDKVASTVKKNRALHQARVVDLWALFPYFCCGPSDIDSSLSTMTATCARAVDDSRYPQLLPIICQGLKNLEISLDNRAQENAAIPSPVTSALQDMSVKLLPALFKIVTTTQTNADDSDKIDVDSSKDNQTNHSMSQDRNVTDAISALAKLAPKDFRQSLFKKLMHRLLEEVQAGTTDDDKICAYLCLSQALVASNALEDSEVSILYRALKPLIRTDEHKVRVQKRAYKVLFEICQRCHSFIARAETLDELVLLLTETIATSQVSARHMRLKCMAVIVNGFDDVRSDQVQSFFKATPEILLCLKDTNAKTRTEAMDLLVAMTSKGGVDAMLKNVTAALGAQTSHMRSAAVLALSRLVYEFAWDNAELQASLPSLLSTVLVLIDANSREVIRSVIGFIRVSVAAIPPEQLEPLVPGLVESLTRYHKPKNRFRSKIKIILKKLIKLFGYDALMPHVPESESRLLTHMRKVSQRQERKKQESRASKEDATQFDELLESDEEDSDDGRTFTSGTTRQTKAKTLQSRVSGKSKASATTAVSSRHGAPSIRLPNDASGEIVDMLGAKHTRHVQFAEDSRMHDDSDSDGALEFDDDGRLVIRDVSEVSAEVLDSVPSQHRKRQRTDGNASKSRQGSRSNSKSNQLGSNYKAKKAGGDVKRKGQTLEPYAYVPLDGRQYSKKNRRNAVEQMSSVVRSGNKRKR